MQGILIKAAAFIAIIFLGYRLKRAGLFGIDDFRTISKIMTNITIPCAAISNIGRLSMGADMLLLLVFGVGCNLLMVGAGILVSRNQGAEACAFNIINHTGYNVGTFTLPFAQSFLGPISVMAACVFDAGNTIFCAGGAYAIASSRLGGDGRIRLGDVFGRCIRSVAINTYFIMVAVSILRIPVPAPVFVLTDIVASSTGFLAMLNLGIGFNLTLNRSQMAKIFKVIGLRHGASIVMSLLFYYLLPFPLEVRRALAFVLMAPLTSLAAPFTERCGGDVAASSAITSMSILISVGATVLLLAGMNLA